MTRLILILCALGTCVAAQTTRAQTPNPSSDGVTLPFKDKATLAFSWENDSYANTDRNYTNGMRLSWLSGANKTDGVSKWLAQRLGAEDGDSVIRRGIAVGHALYTPEDISTTSAVTDSHPYAAWATLEYTPLIEQKNTVDQFTFKLGLIGPSAQGEWIQNTFHELINVDQVLGWNNQLRDEVTFGVSWDRRLRHIADFDILGTTMDITPAYGLSLGTVHTNARIGGTARLGQDLGNDYGPPRVQPSLSGANFFTPKDRFSWYLFAGVEGRWVAHNRFLDGSLFYDEDVQLDREPWVVDVQSGVAIQFANTQIAFTLVYRTEEYIEQTGPQKFGAFSLSQRF